jgi:ubiquinone/menaquinone biosynthesis C-methylase UbiE
MTFMFDVVIAVPIVLAAALAVRVWRTLRSPLSIEQATAAYYDNAKLHRRYDHPVPVAYATPKVAWAYAALRELGVDVSRSSLLDVGGGNGYFSHILLSGCPDTHVLDVSAAQLAMNPLPDARKHLGTAYALPFADASFDVVFSSNLLHHLDRPECAVREMTRVARRAVVVIEPSADNFALWLAAHFFAHERQARKFTRAHVEGLLRDAALTVRRHTFTGGLVLPNRTRAAALPYLFTDSTHPALCMSQMFVCTKQES